VLSIAYDFLEGACCYGYTETAKILLEDIGLKITEKQYKKCIENACTASYDEILSILLKHNDCDIYNLEYILELQNPTILRILLEHGQIDPTALLIERGETFLSKVITFGHRESLVHVLRDPRVNISGDNFNEFINACKIGDLEKVDLMLKDGRIDPTEKNNYAYNIARFLNETSIVNRLLLDERVSRNLLKNSND
jgi:hypothetical protein